MKPLREEESRQGVGGRVFEPPLAGIIRRVKEYRRMRAGGAKAEAGFAIVLVLAVCAVTVLVLVAFFIRSTQEVSLAVPESAMRCAEDLGAVSRSLLLRDLKQEMLAGSNYPAQPGESSLVRVQTETGRIFLLYPASPQTAVPARMAPEGDGGFQTDFPNLLKWSSRYSRFFSDRAGPVFVNAGYFPAAEPAAPVSTRSRPAAGRGLGEEYWRASRMFPHSPGSRPVEIPEPDWMLLTARGARVRDLSNQISDPVVGRFAFMMYDQGGMLDWNVAGFLPSITAEDVAGVERGFKGGMAFADLGVLLTACGVAPSEAKELWEGLLKWRNDGSYVPGDSRSPALRMRDAILGERYGFLGGRPLGDRAFAGRSQLIGFVQHFIHSNPAAVDELLQRSTHFSRGLSQPSLHPERGMPAPRTESVAGTPAFLEQRFLAPANSTERPEAVQAGSLSLGKRLDGSLIWPGQLLVPKRFAINRLGLLQEAQMNRAEASRLEPLIFGYFGLRKLQADGPWIYRDSDRSATRILTLAEVAALPSEKKREPDFLELLKAAVAPGALMPWVERQRDNEPVFSVDEMLVQILANLVDQYDADGYPTRILFWDAQTAQAPRVFSGIEHLPYLHRTRSMLTLTRQSAPPSPFVTDETLQSGTLFTSQPVPDRGSYWAWQDIGLWNPHSGAGALSGEGPTRFRVTARTAAPFGLRAAQSQQMQWEDLTIPNRAPDPAVTDVTLDGEQFQFSIARTALLNLSRPVYVSEAFAARWMTVEQGEANRFPGNGVADENGNPLVGIGLAEVPRVFSVAVQQGDVPRNFSVFASQYEPVCVGGAQGDEPVWVEYALQYLAPNAENAPNWITYDQKFSARVGIGKSASDQAAQPECWEFSDPRFGRFGVSGSAAAGRLPVRYINRFGEEGIPDGDGVVRRAAGAYALGGTQFSSDAAPARSTVVPSSEQLPLVLNRPFRSVAEMGYAWAGLPWKQIDFSTPESGFSGLLDVFCVAENEHPRALEAGRVSLNTRHPEVLEAIFYGTRLDETNPRSVLSTGTAGSARRLAEALVARTSSADPQRGPLTNLRELVGTWRETETGRAVSSGTINGSARYHGFASELPVALAGADWVLRSERARSSVMRALADSGQTRVWNLLVDVVVQSGRYPRRAPGSRVSAAGAVTQSRQNLLQSELEKFVVEAQQRFWWHLAIDRLTGEVLDEAVEVVDP